MRIICENSECNDIKLMNLTSLICEKCDDLKCTPEYMYNLKHIKISKPVVKKCYISIYVQ